MITTALERWPHQIIGFDDTVAAILAGEQRICLTSPTGGGKTTIVTDLIEWATQQTWPSALYTHRIALFNQTATVLDRHGIEYGRRAAGYDLALLRDVQLAMIQSEASAISKGRRELHRAKLVLIDEAHCLASGTMERFINEHIEAGAHVVGVTATPLDIGHLYSHLVVAGCNSELRECGALVLADHYGPDEPDLSKIKNYVIGDDLSDADNRKVMIRPGIVERVYEKWCEYNPDGLPTLLFGPDVAGSKWFAEQFYHKHGVPAAHIDSKHIWINGETYPVDQEHRDWLRHLSETGEVKIVCNRFVMREGIDWPHIACGVFATVFGALTSYLQSAGRILRAHPSLDRVTLIDHGGNWHRHGSVNADREWDLSMTNRIVTGMRAEAMRDKKEPEPITCPKCHAIRLFGSKCHKCGYEHTGKSRLVVQADGKIRKVDGDIYKPRRVALKPDTVGLWRKMYHRARKSRTRMTFRQALSLFAKENGWYYPPKDIPLMPKSDRDFFRSVADVPAGDLR